MSISDFEAHSTVGSVTPFVAKVYTLEEIKEKLRGCVKISNEKWDTIEYGTQIRYFKKNGDFKAGGYVVGSNKITKEGKKYFLLRGGKYGGKNSVMWSLYYDDITKLFIQPSTETILIRDELKKKANADDVQDAFNKVASMLKKYSSRLKKLESMDDNASVATGVTVMSDFLKHKTEPEEDGASSIGGT